MRMKQVLVEALAHALRSCAEGAGREVHTLAADLHPWNGVFELSILSVSEQEADPSLSNPAEMAAWDGFQFTARSPGWCDAVADFKTRMREDYLGSSDRAHVADRYFEMVAAALCEAVRAANLEVRVLSVAHPDSGREFIAESKHAG